MASCTILKAVHPTFGFLLFVFCIAKLFFLFCTCLIVYPIKTAIRYLLQYSLHVLSGLELQCNKNTYVVGETVTCSCSSDIGGDVTWTSSTGVTFGAQSSIFVDTDSHGDVYTCSLSSSCGSQQESVTVDVTSTFVCLTQYVCLPACLRICMHVRVPQKCVHG